MNRDDVIRMAREAGLARYVNDVSEKPFSMVLEDFAALVAAAEREACAEICEGFYDTVQAARAIRARGEKA